MCEVMDDAAWVMAGRPGRFGRARDRRRREFDERFGVRNWRIRHCFRSQSLDRAAAALLVEDSYERLLSANPQLVEWLCVQHADVYENAISNLASREDYTRQERKIEHAFDIAIRRVLRRLERRFLGKPLLKIGGRGCRDLSVSPGRVPFCFAGDLAQPVIAGWWQSDSVMAFWESNKVLEVKVEPET